MFCRGRPPSRVRRATATAAALALLVAACADDDDDAEVAEGDFEFDGGQVEIVNPFDGGRYESQSRAFAPHFEEHLPGDATVGVRNAPGGGGAVAYNEAWNAEPDGRTLTVGAALADGLRAHGLDGEWDPLGWNWIGGWFLEIPAIGVSADLGIDTVEEFVELGQQGELSFGVPGRGSDNHAQIEIFARVTGMDADFVFYEGAGPARTGLARGEVDAVGATDSSIKEWMEDGDLAWGILLREDDDAEYPDLPTIADLDLDGEDYDQLVAVSGTPRGWYTTEGVPDEVVAALRHAFEQAMEEPEFLEFLEDDGIEPNYTPGEEIQQSQADNWPALEEILVPIIEEE